MAELVNITIDGTGYQVEKGIPVLLAAERAGVRIPHLCYYEGTSVFAGCRVCVVQIDGARGMPTSCTTLTAEGQVVWTRTLEVLEMQRGVMALIMADHPDRCLTCHRQKHCGINDVCLRDSVVTYRCLTCAKNKRCEFQGATEELEMFKYPMRYYQEEHAWYGPGHVETPIRRDNPFIELDFNECILCARCVRTCDEIRGLSCYELSSKGPAARIDTSFGLPLQAVGCDACGACIDACPVNTIMDRPSKWAGPSQRTVTTTCPHCGDGCQLDLETKRDRLLRVAPNKEGPSNHGFASARGRYGLGFIHRSDRLRAPLVRKDGTLVEVSWEEALGTLAARLAPFKGPAFGCAVSPSATNEENYALQKFTRVVMGSPNIDHYARLDERAMMQPVAEALGYPAMTGSMDSLEQTRCLFIMGSDTAVTHPVAAWRARQAARFKGGTLIVADPRQNEMTDWAHIWLRYRPGTEQALAAGMLRTVLDESLLDPRFVERCGGIQVLEASLAGISLQGIAQMTGVEEDQIRAAARAVAGSGASTILFDSGITQYNADPAGAVAALVDLCLATGNLGRPGAGLAALRGAANQQGTDDLGCRPDLLPGYRQAPDAGLTFRDMLLEGSPVRTMLIAGIDPVADDPERQAIAAGLQRLDVLGVLSEFLTPTAQLADVVLPLAVFAEQDGTFTNTERRVQRVNRIFDPPAACRPGWAAVRDLAAAMGSRELDWGDSSQVFAEIAAAVPLYGGMSTERLINGALQWPCGSADSPGTVDLGLEDLPGGLPRFLPFRLGSTPSPEPAYPLLLARGREVLAYHKEVLTAQGDATAPPYEHSLRIHPDDAVAAGVEDGGPVRVSLPNGGMTLNARITDQVPQGSMYLTLPLIEDTTPLQQGQAAPLPEQIAGPPLQYARLEGASLPVDEGQGTRRPAGSIPNNGENQTQAWT